MNLLISLFLVVYSFVLQANPRDLDKASLREQCRKKIAGLYLNLWDQNTKEKAYLQNVSKTVKNMRARKQEVDVALNQLKQKIDKNEFDATILDQYNQAKARSEALKSSLSIQNKLLSQAKIRFSETNDQFKSLNQTIQPIFKLTKMKYRDGSVLHKLDYKVPCPRNMATCALKRRDAEAIQHVTGDLGSLPEECLKYSRFLNR